MKKEEKNAEFKRQIAEVMQINSLNINSFRSIAYMAERAVISMLREWARREHKNFEEDYRNPRGGYWDGYAPNGIGSFEGKTVFEIKVFRNERQLLGTWERWKYVLQKAIADEVKNLCFIVLCEVSADMRERFLNRVRDENVNVVLWDIDDFGEAMDAASVHYVGDLSDNFSKYWSGKIAESVAEPHQEEEKRSRMLARLGEEYRKDRLVLFVRAGASKDAGVVGWDELISELSVTYIDRELKKSHISVEETEKKEILSELNARGKGRLLLQARLLRHALDKDFSAEIKQILYRKKSGNSELLKQIVRLCTPERGKFGIRAIVDYNFDDLIETALEKGNVRCRPVYRAGITPETAELGIYHVHGFLPRKEELYPDLEKSLLIFSEESYHRLLSEPYHWANLCQLNFLNNNTCLFVGLSMTDTNLRRLLEAAWQNSDSPDECRHYAILKKETAENGSRAKRSFARAYRTLQEESYAEFGIDVLWVDDYSEIPALLRQIKDGK